MFILLAHVLRALVVSVSHGLDELRRREQLAGLDAHLLKDVGAPQSLIARATACEDDYLRRAGNLYEAREPYAWQEAVRGWIRRSRSRAELASMGERELRDLALSGAHAMYEASKPFWRA